MRSINEDIKNGQFKQVYLLYGEEAYLRKQYRDKLRNAMSDPGDTMNTNYFEGKDISFPQIIDLAETMPFFADRRLIIIENSSAFKQGGEQMADYLKEPAETVSFLFIEEDIDKRSRLFKTVKDRGRAVEFAVQDEQTLRKWIRGLVAKEHKNISEAGIHLFLDKTGSDMENIRKELEKLICYTLDKDVITEQDIREVCTTRITNRIFDMINAIADRKPKQALRLYHDLLELREPPMRILALITRQFNLLLQVKELRMKRTDRRIMSEKTGLHSFIVEKYERQADKFKKEALYSALEACAEAEESVKTGRINDKMSIELLICRELV